MYRQKSFPFGHPQIRVNSVPENYSGNAFSIKADEFEKNEEIDESKKNLLSDNFEEEKPLSEKENKLLKIIPSEKSQTPHIPKINIPNENAILFLTLLVLAAGEEKNDGALIAVLLLLLIN